MALLFLSCMIPLKTRAKIKTIIKTNVKKLRNCEKSLILVKVCELKWKMALNAFYTSRANEIIALSKELGKYYYNF